MLLHKYFDPTSWPRLPPYCKVPALLGEIALATNPAQREAPLAAPHFERGIAILQQIGAENELALTYAGYGRLHQQQGDLAQTRTYLTRALAIFERLGTLHEPDWVRRLLALQEGVYHEA
jgi:tetratricopeptide (TPR) repeat protein